MSVRQFTSDALSMTVCVNENKMNLCIRGTYASMTKEQASGGERGGRERGGNAVPVGEGSLCSTPVLY